MKINYLKINEFGKLKNKEIKLEKNINLIYGKNESGKTTLLKFIYSMFYGISKNKNGKDISDFDKYKPWKGEDFSGKIKYSLDNNYEYEIYREFLKKNPKIYNSNLEDISKTFNIDKTKGNRFFYDQTKIDEALFLSTNLVEQNSVVLDENNQNILTQKIANILSSGEENSSYKKVIMNLSKKLLEEVGTDRSTDRPINRLTEELNELKKIKQELNKIEENSEEIKLKKKEIKSDINNLSNEIELINEIKNIKENEKIEKEKINYKKSIKNEFNEKKLSLKNKLNNFKNENNKIIKNNKLNIINLFFIIILIFLNIIINFIKINKIIENTIIFSTIIYLLFNFIYYFYKKIINNKENKIKNIEKIKNEKEIEILEENIKKIDEEINKLDNELENKNKIKKEEIKNKYKNIINENDLNNLLNKNLSLIYNEIDFINKNYNNKKIELNNIYIEERNIQDKIENKLDCDERIKYIENQIEELHSLERSINLAKDVLEESYKEVKNDITPKFTKDLSLLIERISNGKYKNAKFDTDEGLIVEKEDGEYINSNNLSIGTIDQLYLSLRLSVMNEISTEKMSIILDESFAFYDNERLENIIKFINENYTENQILIFTCSNREKDILEKLNIKYNFIEL